MCSPNVMYNPSSDTFNETKITLTNLEPVTTYTVQIHATNGVSHLTDLSRHSNESSLIATNDITFSNASFFNIPLDLNEVYSSYYENH